MSEKEFIELKYNKIINGRNVIILEPMSLEREKKLEEIISEYTDLVSFSIGNKENKRLVIRYRPNIEEHLDFSKILSDASKAYKNHEYNKCIENCLLIFKLKHVKSFVYNLLGLSYLKLNNKKLAIDYLTITDYMFKEENIKEIDYTELLLALKGHIDKNNRKLHFKMKLEEFVSDDNNYGINNIDEIINTLNESNIDVETFGKINQLSNEEINIIKLLFAKRYFLQGEQKKGNEFIKSVEQNKDKSKFVNNILNEIRKNKKVYINKEAKIEKRLSLTIKPK